MSHPAYRAEKRRWRFWSGYAAALFLFCSEGASSGVSASPPSLERVEALRQLAASKPLTAAALLYVMLKADDVHSGVFYLPGVPTPHDIAQLLSLQNVAAEDFPLQTNLYGDVSYYTEVHWSLGKLSDHVVMVSAHAQLVNAAAVKVVPSHVIEPLTCVLMVGRDLRVLRPACVD